MATKNSMHPYYQDSHCTIYLGDCREILSELEKVDLVLTDPPYGIDVGNQTMGKGGGIAEKIDYGVNNWDKTVINWDLMWKLICLGGNAIVFGGNYYPMPPSSKWFVWDKDNGETDFADSELAWTNLKGAVRNFKFKWQGMLQENMKNKEWRQHPTQKPVPLMRWCIEQAPDPQTILDPFMGSGTTLRAAKDLNRKCIGIEIEEKYCEIAVKRLAQEVLQF